MENILLIEDDIGVSRYLELELKHEGYRLVIENDGESGLERAANGEFNLILLDIMLPTMSGIEVLRRLRQAQIETPVIMLTAKGEVSDKVAGLDSGANDYITKPFFIEELLARMRVIFRKKEIGVELRWGELVIDHNARQVMVNDREIVLTKKEYDLLYYLMVNRNVVLSREKIIEQVWRYEFYSDTNIVDVFVKNIRRKLEEVMKERFIQTVRGVGYVIKDQ